MSPLSRMPRERGKAGVGVKGPAADSATTPGGVLSGRKTTRDLLNGTPSRNRAGEERKGRRSSSAEATGRKAEADDR